MSLLHWIHEWFHPQPKRDPELERVLSVSRTTQQRRERSHASLMAFLERDAPEEHEPRNGHAD